MTKDKAYRFSSYRLDPQTWRLNKDSEFRPLRPKTFALLRHLLDNAGRLVTKDDLMAAVWPGVKVTDSTLPTCMNELRQALEDDPHQPRFVETVHRLGYRFIAPVAITEDEVLAPQLSPKSIMVGRADEMALLREAWQRAVGGTRQVIFVAGEPGIGKTTLVDHFVRTVESSGAAIGRGQCAEQLGEAEAYLPIFEALGQICTGPAGKEASEILLREAPAWACRMPELREAAGPQGTQPRPARMVGELAASLDAIAELNPVMLVCEDLHASDRATIELIDYLAKRRHLARLLIVGTYRSNGPRSDPAPFREVVRELRAHQQCKVLRLKGLTEADIGDYLHRRAGGQPVAAKLAHQMYGRTGGNALFMAAIADQLEALRDTNGSSPDDLRHLSVPDNIHDLITHQIEELSEEDQEILQAASVAAAADPEFSSAALAAALERPADDQDQIEQESEQLTRRVYFLYAAGVVQWPDGTIAAGYGFRHSLYQEVLHGMMGAGLRARAHLRVAKRLEAGYGERAREVASELAMHFERGGDTRSAVAQLAVVVDIALKRGTARIALAQIERATKLLETTPRDQDRMHLELDLEMERALALAALRTPASKFDASTRRIAELAEGQWSPQQMIMQGLLKLYSNTREALAAQTLIATGLRQLESSRSARSKDALAQFQSISHWALGLALNLQGRYADAISHADRAMETYDPAYQPASFDTRIQAAAEGVASQWFLGYPDKAKKRARHAIELGEKISHVPSTSMAMAVAATVHWYCREWSEVLAHADRLIAFVADKDLPYWQAWGKFFRGSAMAELGELRHGCMTMRAASAELDLLSNNVPAALQTHAKAWLYLVEANGGLRPADEAIRFVQEAIDDSIESRITGPLVSYYRIMGLLRLTAAGEKPNRSAQLAAEKSFQKSIETARLQSAKSFELRASIDLARLWQRQGKAAQARKMLSSIYGWFKEGLTTPDLKDAKALIAALR